MMFFIIGADAQQYGPSTAEEVLEWIGQGRADRNTVARRDGEAEWKTLGSFPEFAEALGAQADSMKPPLIQPVQNVFACDLEFGIGDCFTRASHLLGANLGTLVGASFIAGALDVVAANTPVVNLISPFLQGGLYGGLALVFLRRVRGMEASPGMVFAGFGRGYRQLALAAMLMALLTSLASLFCMLPGIYLKVAWALTLPLIVDKGLEFWSAMETCRRITTRIWLKMCLLIVLAFSPFLLSQFYFYFQMYDMLQAKLAAIIPQTAMSAEDLMNYFGKAWPIMVEVSKANYPRHLLAEIVWLVNLPFGAAVLIYAYEALFNPGKTPRAQP